MAKGQKQRRDKPNARNSKGHGCYRPSHRHRYRYRAWPSMGLRHHQVTTRNNEGIKEMYFSNEEIKRDLLENWAQIEGNRYPLDVVREYAEGYSPVYYNDILKDWAEMPSEFDDRWPEITPDANGKRIFDLMSIDLWIYYSEQAEAVYNEIKEEKEANE